jgi:hypothetical protein
MRAASARSPLLVVARQRTAIMPPARFHHFIDGNRSGTKLQNCANLPDGQQLWLGASEDVKKAREIIEGLSEYWPADYKDCASGSVTPHTAGTGQRTISCG